MPKPASTHFTRIASPPGILSTNQNTYRLACPLSANSGHPDVQFDNLVAV
jgi:hypothetical protein